MGTKNGKDILIKVDMTSNGQFETIAGLRATRISFNAEGIDVINFTSKGGWRELSGGAGNRSAVISGSGVFKDPDAGERALQVFFDAYVSDFQVIIPGLGTVEGPFQISALEYSGSRNGEATYELSLDSAGALSFTAL